MFEAECDCIVIGAGVVGLAVAREMAMAGHEVLVLESENAIGTGTSSRNSEVIHAGIYYPQGSLKAIFCVSGKEKLYRYCQERNIAHSNCGKLIVATEEKQISTLASIRKKAADNYVHDIETLTAAQVKNIEPELHCVAALYSPSSGIIDSHSLMLSYLADLEHHGGKLILQSPVIGGEIVDDGICLSIGGKEPTRLTAKTVINCGGLFATQIAERIAGMPKDKVPQIYYAKGNYYSLSSKVKFKKLIYPVPESAGLGVHLTLDLMGNARFGPDVEWVEDIDYHVDPKRADVFYAEVRKYWPALADNSLLPAYSGIRPKLQAPGESKAKDFVIQGPKEHGIAGLCNLYGIESPGLTSSLAIAEYVKKSLAA